MLMVVIPILLVELVFEYVEIRREQIRYEKLLKSLSSPEEAWDAP